MEFHGYFSFAHTYCNTFQYVPTIFLPFVPFV